MARARVETPTMPMRPSARACFDDINSTKATAVLPTPAAIRFFDEHTCYISEQLENHDDGSGARQKIFRPKYVAIGPRFHGKDDLKRGQELKRLAAWDFWEYSDQPFSALYAQVEAVAGAARASYASSAAMDGFTDEEFTAMMFVDGCFLLQLIAHLNYFVDGGAIHTMDPNDPRNNMVSALSQIGNITTLSDDIFMVENQIPWVVLHALMVVRPIQVMLFIDRLIAIFFDKRSVRPEPQHRSADDYEPVHLLDLLCKRHIGRGPARTMDELFTYTQLEVVTLTSATDLGEAGVHIRASRTPRFADIGFWWRWPVFGRLSLPPLVLGHTTLCLLLNMLAFELLDPDVNRGDVAAYFGMLSALMVREEDVRELRRKGIVHTTLSDKEVMRLLKKLEPHTYSANATVATYFIRASINDFFKRQWLWIAVHRFIYNNLKFLVAIGSFLSISLSILKAILALPAGSSNN